MDHHGMEATSLTEAIKLAGRRRLAAWSSSTAPTGSAKRERVIERKNGGRSDGARTIDGIR